MWHPDHTIQSAVISRGSKTLRRKFNYKLTWNSTCKSMKVSWPAITWICEPNGAIFLHNHVIGTIERNAKPIVSSNIGGTKIFGVEFLDIAPPCFRPLLAHQQLPFIVEDHSIRNIRAGSYQGCNLGCLDAHLLYLSWSINRTHASRQSAQHMQYACN